MHKIISLEDAKHYIQNGAILIDVRNKSEYEKGHLNGAINITSTNILNELKKYSKETYIILYCSTGKRSRLVYDLLKNIGYNNVYDLGKVSC